jgi:hypothetical protein
MNDLARARELGLEEEELAVMLDELSPGIVDSLCEALVRFAEALAEVGG